MTELLLSEAIKEISFHTNSFIDQISPNKDILSQEDEINLILSNEGIELQEDPINLIISYESNKLYFYLNWLNDLFVGNEQNSVFIKLKEQPLNIDQINAVYCFISSFINCILLYDNEFMIMIINKLMPSKDAQNYLKELLSKLYYIAIYLQNTDTGNFLQKIFYFVNLTIQMIYCELDSPLEMFDDIILTFIAFIFNITNIENILNRTLLYEPLIKLINHIYGAYTYSEKILEGIMTIYQFTVNLPTDSTDADHFIISVFELTSNLLYFLKTKTNIDDNYRKELLMLINIFYNYMINYMRLDLRLYFFDLSVESIFYLNQESIRNFYNLYNVIKSLQDDSKRIEMFEKFFEILKMARFFHPGCGDDIDCFNNDNLCELLVYLGIETKNTIFHESILNIVCDSIISTNTIINSDIINIALQILNNMRIMYSNDQNVFNNIIICLTSLLLKHKCLFIDFLGDIINRLSQDTLILNTLSQDTLIQDTLSQDILSQEFYSIYIDFISALLLNDDHYINCINELIYKYISFGIIVLNINNDIFDNTLISFTNYINTLLIKNFNIDDFLHQIVDQLMRTSKNVCSCETLILIINKYCCQSIFKNDYANKIPDVCKTVLFQSDDNNFKALTLMFLYNQMNINYQSY